MEGVQLQMEKNGNSKEREEIMDTSALQEFDVTASYSFVDSHYQ